MVHTGDASALGAFTSRTPSYRGFFRVFSAIICNRNARSGTSTSCTRPIANPSAVRQYPSRHWQVKRGWHVAGSWARLTGQQPVSYPRHRFPAEIIGHAVWLYHVFSLSLRDVELILAERGVAVTHESIRHWCRKFGADFARRLRRRRPQPGDTWHLDEVFIRIRGMLHYLWRAVDQHGVVLDILVQERRNGAAAKRFFRRLLRGRDRPKPGGD
jgi:hypothetical protein